MILILSLPPLLSVCRLHTSPSQTQHWHSLWVCVIFVTVASDFIQIILLDFFTNVYFFCSHSTSACTIPPYNIRKLRCYGHTIAYALSSLRLLQHFEQHLFTSESLQTWKSWNFFLYHGDLLKHSETEMVTTWLYSSLGFTLTPPVSSC